MKMRKKLNHNKFILLWDKKIPTEKTLQKNDCS